VEFASNLIWLLAAISLLAFTYREVRAGSMRVSMASALVLAFVLGIILLPVISVSDDLLAARQATLPAPEQVWRLVSHDASVGVDTLVALGAYLLLLLALQQECRDGWRNTRVLRPMAARLARAQRLRPPPMFA
jgi:hypothetical protein